MNNHEVLEIKGFIVTQNLDGSVEHLHFFKTEEEAFAKARHMAKGHYPAIVLPVTYFATSLALQKEFGI